MATTLSLRRLWTIYKRTAAAHGTGVRKRDLALAAFGAIASAIVIVRADVPSNGTQVFGFEIGSKFHVPKCVGKDAVYRGTKVICWEDDLHKGPKPNGEVSVVFPAKEAPIIAKGTSIVVTVLDGTVEGVAFGTHGAFDIDKVTDALIQKFGAATTNRSFVLQNAMGAKFPGVERTWKLHDATVTYKSHPWDSIDEGDVSIYTPKAAKYREEQVRRVVGSGTPL